MNLLLFFSKRKHRKFWLSAFLSMAVFQVGFSWGEPPCSCCGDITLTTQAEVDNYDCGIHHGNLDINGNGITNLNGLSELTEVRGELDLNIRNITDFTGLDNLTSVEGMLFIDNNESLTSLTGLGNLTSVGGNLVIASNESLTDLTGFDNLTSVGGDLIFINSSSMTSFTGLDNLTSIGGGLLFGGGVGSFTNFTGLGNLTSIGEGLNARSIGTLTSLTGLDNLTTVGGNFTMRDNVSVTSLAGLAKLTTVGGDFTIRNNGTLTSLTGLDSLTTVGGRLEINYIGSLTSLTGLENLTTVGGSLTIENNGSLTNLTGLENLTSVGETLTIFDNESLTNLTGLDNLTTVEGGVSIRNNGSLTSLTGLENLPTIGVDFTIRDNGSLTSLSALENLTTVERTFSIENNGFLTSLTGLGNLTTVGMDLSIEDNVSLTSLTGLDSLTSIGNNLLVDNNGNLPNLTGLENLVSIGNNLYVRDNSSLTDCCVIETWVENNVIANSYAISNNATGCDSYSEIEEACINPCEDDLTLTTQAEVDAYDCEVHEGNLTVSGSGITNLNGLSGLTEVQGDLQISGTEITDLTGLDNLTSFGGGMRITDNLSLTSLTGLDNLTSVGGEMEINNNTSLTSLTDLDNLTSVGENLKIIANPSLTNLTGLDNLTTVGGDLDVVGNGNLSSLAGLGNTVMVGGDLEIFYNASLSDCCSIDSLLENNGVTGSIDIGANSTGCNNQEQIEIACDPCKNDLTLTTQAEVDAYDCEVHEGDLTVQGSGIANLNGLSELTEVEGTLTLMGNITTDLTGLDNLTTIGGDLVVSYNGSLTSLSGLDNLSSIGGKLVVSYNGSLTSISSLGNLTSINTDMTMNYNYDLPSLTGLDNIVSVGGNLTVAGNSSLSDCCSIDSLLTNGVTGSINISNNATNCDNQSVIEIVCNPCRYDLVLTTQAEVDAYDCEVHEANLTIIGSGITNLNGLSELTEVVGNLGINGVGITDFTGLGNLTSVGGQLYIEANSSLTSFTGLGNLNTVGDGFVVVENASLTSFTGLNNLTGIGAFLGVGGNPSLTNFSGLDNLTTIGTYSRVWENPSLTNFSGLDNLTTIGGALFIEANSSLTNFTGLGNLNTVEGEFIVVENASLTNFAGLGNLNTVEGEFIVVENASLTNFSGLDNLTAIGSFMWVVKNPSLTSFSGLGNLTTIEEDLYVVENASLTSLAGLDNLTTIGEILYVFANESLSSVAGLGSLVSVADGLLIGGNPSLSDCCILENLFTNGVVGDVLIGYNAPGCNAVEEITEPAVAICRESIEVYLDENGTVEITPAQVDSSSLSYCGMITSYQLNQTTFDCLDAYATLPETIADPPKVTLTVTDDNGDSDECETEVLVMDNHGPTLDCHASVEVVLDSEGHVQIEYSTMAPELPDDNCIETFFENVPGEGPVPYSGDFTQEEFDCADIGAPIMVTMTVEDIVSGLSDDCTVAITVLDEAPPVLTCHISKEIVLDEHGSANITVEDFLQAPTTDNCTEEGDLAYMVSQSAFTCADLDAPVPAVLTVDDEYGNTDQCTMNVTVKDEAPPVVNGGQSYPFEFNVYLDANGNGIFDASNLPPVVTDNCTAFEDLTVLFDGQTTLHYDCSAVGIGPSVHDLSFSDEEGNANHDHQVQITVLDTIKPMAICQNIPVVLDLDGEVEVSVDDINDGSSDNCGAVELSIGGTQGAQNITMDCDDVPSTSLTLEVRDLSGNLSTCNAVVTVSSQVNITQVNATDESCEGAADGYIEIVATGNPQLKYSIDGGINWNVTGVYQDLSPGDYEILVKNQESITCGIYTATVHPGPILSDWYKDMDEDGYSDGITASACTPPAGYFDPTELIAISGDCNDNDPVQHPGQTWYEDLDGDGYGSGTWLNACQRPVGCYAASELIETDTDCDDNVAACYPGAPETCNGEDDDCDGEIDEGISGMTYTGNLFFTTQAAVDAFASCYSTVDGNVTIIGAAINSLSNLGNIEEVTGNVVVQYTGLANMNGLDALTEIGGSLTIFLNTSLHSLDGFDNLSSVGGNLMLYYNFSLPDCCAFYDLLNNNGVGGNVTIFFNLPGCNNQADILNTCTTGNNMVVNAGNSIASSYSAELLDGDKTKVKVFPNPNQGDFVINIDGTLHQGELQLFDTTQRLLWRSTVPVDSRQLNVSLGEIVGPGLYLLVLKNADETISVKVVIR